MTSSMAILPELADIKADYVETPLEVDPLSGLFGILTRPQMDQRETGFILINSGLLHRVGPFRLYVDITRRIALAGFPSIRLDLSGKGDSDGLTGVSLADANVSNILAASRKLKDEAGVKKVVIGGLCSGADDALQAGLELPNLAGILMFDGFVPKTVRYYFHRYGPKFLSARSWLNRLQPSGGPDRDPASKIGSLRNWGSPREMVKRYSHFVDQGTHILAIFSGWAGNCYAYPNQLTTAIGHPRAPELVSELHYPHATHLFPLSLHRQLAVAAIAAWAEHSFPNDSHQQNV